MTLLWNIPQKCLVCRSSIFLEDIKMFNALIIMDGYGINNDTLGNAIVKSGTPNIAKLMAAYPHTTIGASGLDVGLPDGQMGNSEVGHINMGAGRTVYQELTRITKSIADGDFYENEALLKAIRSAKANNKALHTFGLMSDGGVHSNIAHLFAIIKLAKKEGLSNIYVHGFMDGRDVGTTTGAGFVADVQAFMAEENFGTVASVIGRYYAMDRDNRWDRVEKGYQALVDGIGTLTADPVSAMKASYAEGVTDEFIAPIVCTNEDGTLTNRIAEGDSVIFFNFRPDRAREISRAFIKADFDGFVRAKGYLAPTYVGFTQYDATFEEMSVAFKPQSLVNNLGQVIANNNLKQLRIAETEKYAHVTFFFNSGVEAPNVGEDRELIASPKVATYDMQPEMSAEEVTVKACEHIKSGKYDVMILNFANCDMVGHTGDFDAAVAAVDKVDECVGRIIDAIKAVGGSAIITADHGNADKMIGEDGNPFTPHSTYPVPFIVVKEGDFKLLEGGILADVAPTLLDMMNIAKPEEMTGHSLIV